MLVPIGHEDMSARRWPVITIGLILVNLLIFAGTHRTVDQQDSQLWKVRRAHSHPCRHTSESGPCPQGQRVCGWLSDRVSTPLGQAAEPEL